MNSIFINNIISLKSKNSRENKKNTNFYHICKKVSFSNNKEKQIWIINIKKIDYLKKDIIIWKYNTKFWMVFNYSKKCYFTINKSKK